MSFDLKPEIPVSMLKYSILTKSVDDIVWTANRSPVPLLLAGCNISESMWGRTFDLVHGHYDEQLKSINYFMPAQYWLVFIFTLPCFFPCLMAKMIQMNRRDESRWLEILESQQEIYQRFGVEVTLATTTSSGSPRSGRSSKTYTVGLQFTVADDGPPPTGFTTKKVEADDEADPISIV